MYENEIVHEFDAQLGIYVKLISGDAYPDFVLKTPAVHVCHDF